MKVIFVGLGGIPCGKRAIDVRIDALAKLTARVGYNVEVINRFSATEVPPQSSYKVYDPFAKKKKSCGNLKSVFYYALSLLKEPFVIINSNRNEKIGFIVSSSGHFIDVIVYKILCKITGAKLVYEYCEYRAAVSRKGLYHEINGKLLDYYSPKLWDGAICISHYLENACKKVNPRIISTIVYPLCDFGEYANVKAIQEDYKYIMFCGSVEYAETLSVVLEAYKKSLVRDTHKLFLVLRGNQQSIEKIAQEESVIVKTDLPYKELIGFLKGATALLIPVDNTIRDTARFPNKICEYGAVGGLIVTVNNGEMPYVFVDNKNALVADFFTADSFANKLNELCDNNVNLNNIRKEGEKTCKDLFDIESNIEKILRFYNALSSRH